MRAESLGRAASAAPGVLALSGDSQARAQGRRPTRAASPPLVAAGVAWALLLVVEGSPLSWALDHDVLSLSAVPLPAAVLGYSAGWVLMAAATMLPVGLVLAAPGRLAAWLSGYVGAWGLAGFVFAGFDLVLHSLLPPGSAALPVVAVAVAAVWTPAATLLVGHPARDAAGWLHGLACLLTCGPAMLALQAVAPGDLGAMALAGCGLAAVRLVATRTRGRIRARR